MSTPDEPRGREFLEKVRPEAMSHLLAFFKESGRHLDPKTRFLISIVTKVINYSPRGLRQYIKRATEAGATRDEIIDTLLCAYPAAGLTRVADAAAVLLDMDLPAAPADWHPLPGAEALAEGQSAKLTAQGRDFLVTRKDGRLFAIDNICSHRGGTLSEGAIEGDVVTCPLHGWQFHIAGGACAGVGKGNAPAYDVREAGGRAEVRIPPK